MLWSGLAFERLCRFYDGFVLCLCYEGYSQPLQRCGCVGSEFLLSVG